MAMPSSRLVRSQREAEVLAALNHPHLTAIYGGGADALQNRQYDVTRDGRFPINTVVEETPPPITLLMNWRPEGK